MKQDTLAYAVILKRSRNSDVRHPRCVLYTSKELYVNTKSRIQLYLFLYYRSLRHVSALYVGHHQVVVRLTA